MLVKNVSKRRYMHQFKDEIVILDAGATKNIPDVIANIWIKTNDVIVVDDGSKDAEIERLKAENEKLKAQANGEQSEVTGDVALRQELLNRCKELGIRVTNPNTKIETLKNKIAEEEAKLADSTAE